ncbi:GTP-binding GTPase N-terminal [Streptosporangium subroseum]|uniref:GTP-binding GTPase N-terminal n=2 Tax=Streptosporangium subroseum TaxID=106412 RepID=A0A239P3H3_9ACTN|nr:GTP-binding GTPase N-terminal [Streptosporangium subroseum]
MRFAEVRPILFGRWAKSTVQIIVGLDAWLVSPDLLGMPGVTGVNVAHPIGTVSMVKPHRRLRWGHRSPRKPRPLRGQWRPSSVALAGMDVLLFGYISAKQKQYAVLMDELTDVVTTLGARVVGRLVQRRGVSDGGVKTMDRPYSSRTLVSAGKVREIASVRAETDADVVVFLNPLTGHQQDVLTETFNCPVISSAELRA